MNNDLISREALKEDFKSRLAFCNEWIEKAKDKETKIRASAVKAFIGEVIMTIDNAPAFEILPENVIEAHTKIGYERGFNDGYAKCVEDNGRPQGKWIEFAHWVAKEVLDDYFEENSGAFAEIACRKLVKLGLVEVKDNVYKMKGGAE